MVKNYASHRLSHEIYNGEIPWLGLEQLCVLHKCDVRNCVNPLHLYAGTKLQNAIDREERGRGGQVSGEMHYMAALTDTQVIELLDLFYKERWTLPSLSTKFGIAITSVQRYIMGQIRENVTVSYLSKLSADDLTLRGHKLKDSEVFEILRLKNERGESVKNLSEMFGVSKSQIRRYLSGETKPHIFKSYFER